jgi:hypothetical protein
MRLTCNCFFFYQTLLLLLPVFADFLWADVHFLNHVYYDSRAAKSYAAEDTHILYFTFYTNLLAL